MKRPSARKPSAYTGVPTVTFGKRIRDFITILSLKIKDKMHILILPMYYPEKDSSPHRGYMFFEQAMQLAKSGCKVGLAFTEQRPLKNFTWKRFRKESHFQISAEDNGSFVTMRLHAWNPKLSTAREESSGLC